MRGCADPRFCGVASAASPVRQRSRRAKGPPPSASVLALQPRLYAEGTTAHFFLRCLVLNRVIDSLDPYRKLSCEGTEPTRQSTGNQEHTH
jgi:hypothetical protein